MSSRSAVHLTVSATPQTDLTYTRRLCERKKNEDGTATRYIRPAVEWRLDLQLSVDL